MALNTRWAVPSTCFILNTAAIDEQVTVITCSSLYLHIPKCFRSEHSMGLHIFIHKSEYIFDINMWIKHLWIFHTALFQNRIMLINNKSSASCFIPWAETAASISPCVLALGWAELVSGWWVPLAAGGMRVPGGTQEGEEMLLWLPGRKMSQTNVLD